jgi:hypothetical protein
MSVKQAELNPYRAMVFCADIPLSDDAQAALRDEQYVPEYLEKLIEEKHYIDAAQVLAKLMPPREGVWWAAQCVARSFGDAPKPQEVRALRAAERWVTEMTEDARYECYEAAKKARLGSPANCVAMAAFLSGPSLAPRDADIVPPSPDFPAKMVAGTVMASSLSATPELSAAQLATFLEEGKVLYMRAIGAET